MDDIVFRQFEDPFFSAFAKGSRLSADDRAQKPIEDLDSLFPPYNPAIQDSRMTFAFFVESKFIPEHVEHKAPAGRTHYQAILKHLLRPENVNRVFDPLGIVKARLNFVPGWPYLDEVRLCDITSDHVRRLIASASARGYSVQTVKHIRNVLFAIISHAQREGCFRGSNPVEHVKLPPMVRRIEHELTIRQTMKILELMQYPDKEIALFTLMTGMNIAEICELRWKHVNLSGSVRYLEGDVIPPRSIAVRTSWNRAGLGGARRGRNSNIEIQEPLLSRLGELISRDAKNNMNGFVLLSKAGSPIPPESIRAPRLRPIGRKLGIPWLTWQVLRRAHTLLLAEFRAQLNDRIMRRMPGLDSDLNANTGEIRPLLRQDSR
jgi:integrase